MKTIYRDCVQKRAATASENYRPVSKHGLRPQSLLATGCSYAESWTGKLVDATCLPKTEEPLKCDANKGTMNFAIQTSDGKTIKFDAEGNVKTGAVMSAYSDQKGPTAKVIGTLTSVGPDEKVIKIEMIEIQ